VTVAVKKISCLCKLKVGDWVAMKLRLWGFKATAALDLTL
jgi:hypothetical protein